MSDDITKLLDGFVAKVKPVSEAEFNQREAHVRRLSNPSEHYQHNAPKRHWSATGLDESGRWGETRKGLSKRTGTGFLVALVGGRGPGKTQLAVELIRERIKANRSARYVSAVEFFMEVKQSYRKDADETEMGVLKRYRTPELLVIDEIGKRGETAWEDTLLFELIDMRYRDMTDTLLISNQTQQEFAASLGPSLASRMSETGGVVECNWKGWR